MSEIQFNPTFYPDSTAQLVTFLTIAIFVIFTIAGFIWTFKIKTTAFTDEQEQRIREIIKEEKHKEA